MVASTLSGSGVDSILLSQFSAPNGVPKAVFKSAGFFLFFAQTVYPRLESLRSELDSLYEGDNGRPPTDPVRMLAVVILQFLERLPDRQATQAMQYDMRWRLALHLDEGQCACDPSLLSVFRGRLLAGEKERLAFDKVLQLLVDEGWVPKRSKQRIDSTHVCGLLARMGRLERARETIRLVLIAVERAGELPGHWAAVWETYVESRIDPRISADKLKVKLLQAGEDMETILAWALEQEGDWEQAESIRVLRRVFEENYQTDENGQRQQRRAQPAGAVHNPHEPEAQWSSKSTTKDKVWVGYKAQVAETVEDEPRKRGEPTRGFITAIVTQDAIASDKAGMVEVFAQQSSFGLEPPEVTYVDGAYVSTQALKDHSDQGRELMGPAPASPDRGKVFTIEAFEVNVEESSAVCPEGKSNTQCSRLEEGKTGKVNYRFEWNGKLCGSCPLRNKCVSPTQSHRTLVVGQYHGFLQSRRKEMNTQSFKEAMHRRNGIEATQSELIRAYGLRKARYRGSAKVRLQNHLIGTACNLNRLFRRISWENTQTSTIPASVN
jgi:transposase